MFILGILWTLASSSTQVHAKQWSAGPGLVRQVQVPTVAYGCDALMSRRCRGNKVGGRLVIAPSPLDLAFPLFLFDNLCVMFFNGTREEHYAQCPLPNALNAHPLCPPDTHPQHTVITHAMIIQSPLLFFPSLLWTPFLARCQ